MAVLCKIGRISRMKKLNKNLTPVVEYLHNLLDLKFPDRIAMEKMQIGESNKVSLTPDIFVINQKFATRNPETCLFESHRKYIDFQFMISGHEVMETADISILELKDAYDLEKDIMFYHTNVRGTQFHLRDNDLAIFFPEDAHRVGMWDKCETECIKPVVKFPADLW